MTGPLILVAALLAIELFRAEDRRSSARAAEQAQERTQMRERPETRNNLDPALLAVWERYVNGE